MPTSWEKKHHLNPRVDDSRRDKDRDGSTTSASTRPRPTAQEGHDRDGVRDSDEDCDRDGLSNSVSAATACTPAAATAIAMASATATPPRARSSRLTAPPRDHQARRHRAAGTVTRAPRSSARSTAPRATAPSTAPMIRPAMTLAGRHDPVSTTPSSDDSRATTHRDRGRQRSLRHGGPCARAPRCARHALRAPGSRRCTSTNCSRATRDQSTRAGAPSGAPARRCD